MATITIDDPTAQLLRTQAAARGVEVERHVRELAAFGGAIVSKPKRKLSREEIDRWFDDLRSGQPVAASLPDDFSRADVYLDHD